MLVRLGLVLGSEAYQLINVTCNNKEDLQTEIENIFNSTL